MVFIRRAAVTLRHIRLDCTSVPQSEIIPVDFPPLPSLRSIEKELHFWDRDEPWLIELIFMILASNSTVTIKEVVVTYGMHHLPPVDISDFFQSFLTTLEDFPFRHPAAPRLRWRLAYAYVDVARLVNLIEVKMPRLHAAGKLVFEPYDLYWGSEWLGAS
ncbi:hypothetical protein B0H17DRAFT_1339314 [Mycena rosella]|uniref:Uncharacterized protein n=1 Tax=Mycena rosella TaxID=1033263 RepID=A0AAD7C6A7_MYCRO|nr:hypothetical protein B0H17DRAFT_1339314 [Mycena rosella]